MGGSIDQGQGAIHGAAAPASMLLPPLGCQSNLPPVGYIKDGLEVLLRTTRPSRLATTLATSRDDEHARLRCPRAMERSSCAGAGRKIRRHPVPRAAAATPYNRPPAAAAVRRLAAEVTEGGRWVSRLVDPVSSLIAGCAARLFSTVFRKPLAHAPAPAPAPLETRVSAPPGRDAEPKEALPESAHSGLTPVLKGELDHLLMRTTFSRVEFDYLSALLRLRTVEPNLSTQVEYREDKNKTRTRIDGVGGSTSHGMAVDHSPVADDPICGGSSPVDLAKQYMSTRYSREPRSSSLRSRVFRGNKAEASSTCYDSRSGVPLVLESNEFGNENPGLPLKGYATSQLRGRSAICRMARSPYCKGPSPYVSPFSSSRAAGRQALKRRGTDFENELGSIGPIRRIRQKSNMMSPFKDARASPLGTFIPKRKIGLDSPLQESPSSKRLQLGSGRFVQTAETHENDDGKSSSDNVPPVPSQSNKTSEKISEQLSIIVPSPKEEQSKRQSVSGIPGQSNGPNRLSDPSSSYKFEDLGRVNLPHDKDLNVYSLNKTKLMKDGSSKVPSCTVQDSGNKDIKSDHFAISDKPAISVSATVSQKPGFRMVVLEDSYEFDDDQETPAPSRASNLETSTSACVNPKERLGESVTKPTTLSNSDSERGNGRERAGDVHKPLAAPTSTPPLHFSFTTSTSPSLSNGLSRSSSPKLSNDITTDKPNMSPVSSTTSTTFAVSSSSRPFHHHFLHSQVTTTNFGSITSNIAVAKPESTIPETKPASTVSFSTVGST